MTELINGVVTALRKGCGREVYAGFDAVPLPKKSDRLFTVAELAKVQLDPPFTAGSGGVCPFHAEVRISIVTPMTEPAERALVHLERCILPVMEQAGAVLREVQEPQVSARLQRLVLRAVFLMEGIYLGGDDV